MCYGLYYIDRHVMRSLVLCFVCVFALPLHAVESTTKPDFSWRQTDISIALLNHGQMVWEHHHDRKVGKPYMRIGLLDGTELTRPWPIPKDYPKADHTWHRALWWSWKAINGVNFWEENQIGTEPVEVKITHSDDGSASIATTIEYHLPDKAPIVIEKRTIRIGKPYATGTYLIDWQATFTPSGDEDVVFNKNGYGGLAIRMAAEFCGDVNKNVTAWQFVRSKEAADLSKGACRWMAYHGIAQNGRPVAIAMFSHPDNPRFPAFWCTRDQYPYLNPCFISKEDCTLRKEESLTLRYGVLVYQGQADTEEIELAWKSFVDSPHPK